MIGEPAKNLQIGALGSPAVKPVHSTSLLDGLTATAGNGVKIQYATTGTGGEPLPVDRLMTPVGKQHGYQAVYFNNTKLEGQPVLTRVDTSQAPCCLAAAPAVR